MVSFIESVLICWTIRVAILIYLGRVWVEWNLGTDRQIPGQRCRQVRLLWTVGYLFYIAHIVFAFTLVYRWSHAAAFQHTAEQTAAATGVYWGGGLYLNHLLTLIWFVDIAGWWLIDIRFPYRSKIYFRWFHSFSAFMVFQATVVFGPVWWKCFVFFVVTAVGVWYVILRHRQTE